MAGMAGSARRSTVRGGDRRLRGDRHCGADRDWSRPKWNSEEPRKAWPARLGDDDDCDAVSPLQFAQIGEQRRDLA
jgi:hypothetical protein